MLLTISDLAAWDACLSKNQPLSRQSIDTEWAVPLMADGSQPITGYGFGWRNNVVNGRRIIDHAGSFQGFRAHYARFENGLSVALLTNLESARSSYIVRRVAAILDPGLLPLEKEMAGSADATQKTKKAIIALMSGNNDPLLSGDIHKAFDDKHILEIESSFNKVTDDTELVQVGEVKDNAITRRTYRAVGKKVNYIVAEFSDNRIARLNFSAE
ncbi:hypothetical protein ACYZUC_30590 [Pseudomonas sp. GT1P32]